VPATSRRAAHDRGGHHPPRFRPILLAFLLVTLGAVALPARDALAHAEPERAEPPINGRVATAPAKLDVWFTEEVDPDEVLLTVRSADGAIVDRGDTALDLFDPERRHVTVSLKPNLAPGNYVVQWHTLSALDGDAADGFFNFVVADDGANGSPVASPIASPVASPVTSVPSPTAIPNPATGDSDFDSQAFALAVLAGVVVAIGIYLFWRLVKPKPGIGAPPQ
jgi:methionine-rich copper-binding protein CopC